VLELLPEQPVSWDRAAQIGLIGLMALWAGLFYWTWATWGSVTIDSGREMYVPAVLSQGKMLYRDVIYQYPPLAPYFNALLFRLLGVRLEVLYWAGSLSALGSAILLFVTGMRLSCRLIGWTTGAVLLVEGFRRGLFSFPLPYSFASVYGCLVACLFLWVLARMSTSSHWAWKLTAGTTAAVAMLLKLEFGAACYCVLALMIAAQAFRERTWRGLARWLLAILPGVAACLVVAWWMVSIRDAHFITHENMDSWPSSYFMRTYGKMWLKASGFDLSARALRIALLETVAPLLAIIGLRWILRRMQGSERRIAFWIALAAAGLLYAVRFPPPIFVNFLGVIFSPVEILGLVAFPPAMAALLAGTALAMWWFFLRERSGTNPAVALMLTFSALLPFRSLLQTRSYGYSIYYDGPELLCILILADLLVCGLISSKRLRLCGTAIICLACFASVLLDSNIAVPYFDSYATLKTDRGAIRLPQSTADNYRAAIAFIKQRAADGESVMSIPEDTSLYFFSETDCPTRVPGFVPGVVAPGEMTDEVIAEIKQNSPRFLIWSNRNYPEYGTPRFGTDFDIPIGEYLRSHYRPIGSLVPFDPRHWSAEIWERITPANPQ
jgi:hypothetical protein